MPFSFSGLLYTGIKHVAICQIYPSCMHINAGNWSQYVPNCNLFIYLELHIHIPKQKGNTFHLQTKILLSIFMEWNRAWQSNFSLYFASKYFFSCGDSFTKIHPQVFPSLQSIFFLIYGEIIYLPKEYIQGQPQTLKASLAALLASSEG